ncbi:MAG: hypothetical protein ACT4PI_05265 [Actinomycetota bacterium]
MQLRRALLAIGSLALAATPVACSDDGGPAGVEFTEAPVDVEADYINGVVAWKDGFVAVTGSGVVLRSPDGERWDTVDTTGLDDDADPDADADAEPIIRTDLSGITAGDGFLLAAGARSVGTGEDDARFVPMVWRSADGETWQQLETSGLTARYLDAIVASDGAFFAFGTEEVPAPPGLESEEDIEEEEGEGAGAPMTVDVTSVFRSEDGEEWEAVGDPVTPAGENSSEGLGAVAANGGRLLVSLGAECYDCYDDFSNALYRSEDDGRSWQELDDTGLDDLDLANTDAIPRVVGFDSGFVAVGTSEDGDDTVATLWRSADGEKWTDKTHLGGPRDYEYAADIDAMAATKTGVIILELRGDELAVWQVELD